MSGVGCRVSGRCVMSRNRMEDFGAYQDAVRLFDHVVVDMATLRDDPRCYRLIGQQVGSADSICANMDEGFGRLSRTEFIRFLDISRGSARETLGRYKRLKHWLSPETINARVELADGIIARLTNAINTLRANNLSGKGAAVAGVRESVATYGEESPMDSDAITTEEIERLLGSGGGAPRHATPDTL